MIERLLIVGWALFVSIQACDLLDKITTHIPIYNQQGIFTCVLIILGIYMIVWNVVKIIKTEFPLQIKVVIPLDAIEEAKKIKEKGDEENSN